MNKIKLFEIFLWKKNIDYISDELIKECHHFCINEKQKSKGVILSNVGGWHSKNYYMDQLLNTPIDKLFNIILNPVDSCVKKYVKFLKIHVDNYCVDNLWLNINNKNNFNGFHTHPKAFLSGVFYITEKNSPIEFQNPLVSNRKKNFLYTPLKKDLLVFPSSILHCVHPNNDNSDRISIAFNLILKTNTDFNFSENKTTLKYD